MKKIRNVGAFVLAFSTGFAAMNAFAAGDEDFTPAQQARIGKIAADYLVAHPEVLIEVSQKLQAQQAERKAGALTNAALHGHRLLMQLDGVPVKGPANAKVIVTEFFDYECSACSMMAPNMEQVMARNPDVRFAFRDWTIFASRFPESTQASRRGLDIWRQKGADAYMAYHNGIYHVYPVAQNEGKLTGADIEKVAKSAGAAAEDAGKRDQSDQLIAGNDALAQMLGLEGTPGIIVMPAEGPTAKNTTVIPGVVSADVMQQAIDRAAGK
ncbi:thioredoxin domain-containing protein (plasmid) [Paramixta manurensis]|uniref:Thioredoxin domain-containing protein n=1 Tax=Paramixta manurensis TaxID=2740817 RepID=A0A6M8UW51_9GAMM|nr:thioredoxin domain-containing protein [Erwiniaceae bacterium PD-1]